MTNQKPIKRIAAFLFIAICLMSQSMAQDRKNYITLAGIIKNVDSLPSGDRIIEVKMPFGVNQAAKTVHLAKDGSFRDTLRRVDGEYTLWDGKNPVPLYLRKARVYTIRYDADNFRDGLVDLADDDVPINEYFIAKLQKKVFIDRLNLNRSEPQFKKLICQLREEALERVRRAKLPPALKEKETKSIHYEYLSELYFFLALKQQASRAFEMSATSRRELTINYLDERDYKQYGYYQKLVYEYYQTQLRRVEQEQKKINSAFSLEQNEPKLLFSLVPNAYIRNHLIAQRAMFCLKEAGDLEAYYHDFTRYYTGKDDAFKAQMAEAYLRLSTLKVGKRSPDFVHYRRYSGGQASLSEFRGKYVYIDLWATWCGNCWGEMSYLKQLEQAYQGKNIVFISISLDKNAAKWAATVREKQLGGIQLLANPNDPTFVKEYAVYGIPRYILLDPSGAIIAYSAPRPSETEALQDLLTRVGL